MKAGAEAGRRIGVGRVGVVAKRPRFASSMTEVVSRSRQFPVKAGAETGRRVGVGRDGDGRNVSAYFHARRGFAGKASETGGELSQQLEKFQESLGQWDSPSGRLRSD